MSNLQKSKRFYLIEKFNDIFTIDNVVITFAACKCFAIGQQLGHLYDQIHNQFISLRSSSET